MKKLTVSISALFLAMGVLSGCGEKKEEAPKAEAPAAQEGMAGMSGMAAQDAAAPAAQEGMAGMSGMGGMAGQDAAAPAAQEGMAGMSGMGGMAGQDAAAPAAAPAAQEGMAGMAGEAPKQEGMSGMAGQAAGAVDGEKVYKGLCFSCHDAGVAGAPKMGDKADWGPRIAKGADALHKSAIEGRMNVTPGKVMPAKGGNPALSDDEVKAAVDYMIEKNK
jgi:cytochrome c5